MIMLFTASDWMSLGAKRIVANRRAIRIPIPPTIQKAIFLCMLIDYLSLLIPETPISSPRSPSYNPPRRPVPVAPYPLQLPLLPRLFCPLFDQLFLCLLIFFFGKQSFLVGRIQILQFLPEGG